MTLTIRNLADNDLEEVDALLNAAFQSSVSRLQDLRFYCQIEPKGWFVASQESDLVGMVGAVDYGTFAHVGLMAVHPNAQRQGIGLALMQFLLAQLDQQVPAVWLDASEMGRPLYHQLGFVAHGETITYQRRNHIIKDIQTPNVQTMTIQDLDEVVPWDRDIFGADRRKVLQVLLDFFPQRALMQRDVNGQLTGYLFAQKNRIGPWVMLQSCRAEQLLQAALALPYEGPLSVVVPAVNQEAVELVQCYGFEQVHSNQHMGRYAEDTPGKRQKIYAQTSLSAG